MRGDGREEMRGRDRRGEMRGGVERGEEKENIGLFGSFYIAVKIATMPGVAETPHLDWSKNAASPHIEHRSSDRAAR